MTRGERVFYHCLLWPSLALGVGLLAGVVGGGLWLTHTALKFVFHG